MKPSLASRTALVALWVVLLPTPSAFAGEATAEDTEAFQHRIREIVLGKSRPYLPKEHADPWGDSTTQQMEDPTPTPDPADDARLKELFTYAADLRVEARGREPIADLARVIEVLTQEPALVEFAIREARAGDGVCRLYQEEIGPDEGCPWFEIARVLNGRDYRRRALRIGEKVRIPFLKVVPRRFSTVVDPTWAPREIGPSVDDVAVGRARVATQPLRSGDVRVSWQGYGLEIAISDPHAAKAAEARLHELKLPDLSWSVAHRYGERGGLDPLQPIELLRPKYTKDLRSRPMQNPLVHAQQCRVAHPVSKVEGSYGQLLSPEFKGICNFLGVDDATRRTQGSEPALTKVVLIDSEVCEHNDFGVVAGDTRSCARNGKWDEQCVFATGWNEQNDHATHLAGIIVSQPNGRGFIGLNPDAELVAYHHKSESDSERTLALRLTQWLSDREFNRVGPPGARIEILPVFLFASVFTEFDFHVNPAGLLQRAEERLEPEIAIILDNEPLLLIVAAGQTGEGTKQRLDIGPFTPMSPQNLGDLHNVLVVTGCTRCAADNAKLYSGANYSKPLGGVPRIYFVHVAAPAMDLPSAVGDKQYYAQGGTSQAAAYTAGLAAAMIGCFPEAYDTAWKVKRRIQVTARPSFSRRELELVATGIVDPFVATLDPEHDWFQKRTRNDKRANKNYAGKELDAWCSDEIKFRDPWNLTTPPRLEVNTEDILRLVRYRVVEPSDADQWIVYLQNSDQSSFHGRRPFHRDGDVLRVGPVSLRPHDAQIVIGGVPTDLIDVEDLILNEPNTTDTHPGCGT